MTARDILGELVRFPVYGGQSNLSILQWIQDYLDGLGVAYHLVPNESGDKASLHCRIGPAVDGGVILSGHMDVVPVEGQPWQSDPFELTERDGKLYARGSCDMKGFIACCLSLVPAMQAADLQLPLYFAFSYDEEVGCQAGPALVESIKNTYSERPRYAIIGEPSLLEPIVGQKGICVYHTTVTGSQGHSSRIRQEVSAIHEAARLTVWLENKMNELIAAGHTDDRFEPNHTSIHVGVFNGGTAFNVIANHCTFEWDFRTIPSDDQAAIFAAFAEHCRAREAELQARFPDFRITHEEHHPPVPPLDTPADQSVVALAKELTGRTQTHTVSYAAEAGQFALGGFETVICGPGSIEQAHRANEFISIEQLEGGVAMLRRLVARLCEPVTEPIV